jgi:hypothetical protein
MACEEKDHPLKAGWMDDGSIPIPFPFTIKKKMRTQNAALHHIALRSY